MACAINSSVTFRFHDDVLSELQARSAAPKVCLPAPRLVDSALLCGVSHFLMAIVIRAVNFESICLLSEGGRTLGRDTC